MNNKIFVIVFALCVSPVMRASLNDSSWSQFCTPTYSADAFGSTSASMEDDKEMITQSAFYSTSSMLQSDYGSDYNIVALDEQAAQTAASTSARRARPSSWGDPTPIGDVPYVLMLILLAGYACYTYVRTRVIKGKQN